MTVRLTELPTDMVEAPPLFWGAVAARYTLPDEDLLRGQAESLRQHTADLLAGDFSRWPRIEERINERTRRHMIDWLGPERAAQEGWL